MELSPLYTMTAQPPQGAGCSGIAAIKAVDEVFDLSSGNRDIFDAITVLSPDERDEFLDTVASLLHQGVVGVEMLEVRGQPYQSFVETRIAAPELKGTRAYPGALFSALA